jgi:hypothetical protein
MTNSEAVFWDQSAFRKDAPHLILELDKEKVSELFSFLQSGFFVTGVKVGCSISAFLTGQLGISQEYIVDHVSTVFLDGKPVDDLASATIRHRSRLALSSALPGLVGATMRRGSVFASLRNSITYRDSGIRAGGEGAVHMKLFNVVMKDLGPLLLAKGILVDSSELKNFLLEHHDLLKGCSNILFNDSPVEMGALLSKDFCKAFQLVTLSVETTAADGMTRSTREPVH